MTMAGDPNKTLDLDALVVAGFGNLPTVHSDETEIVRRIVLEVLRQQKARTDTYPETGWGKWKAYNRWWLEQCEKDVAVGK